MKLINLSQAHREQQQQKAQINKIRNERREITTDITKIQKSHKNYTATCEQIGKPRRKR